MALKHVQFQAAGSKSFSDITSSFATLLSMTDDADVVYVFNTLDAEVALSFNAGATSHFVLPAGMGFTFDARTNSKRIAKTDVSVKYTDSAPTSGKIVVTMDKV